MNAALRLCYQLIPSFKRESGGTYAAYTAIHSRIYATRMRYLHRRARHGQSLQGRCQWCGADTAR